MEVKDQEQYSEFSKTTEKTGLKQLLGSLSEQEKGHAGKLRNLLETIDLDETFKEFNADTFRMEDYVSGKIFNAKMNYNDLLTAIIDREEKAFQLYSFLSTCTRTAEVSFLFSTIAFEEQKHKSWAVDRYELEMLASL